MNATTERRALRAGTEIDYCGMSAVVVADSGGERITVSCEGHVQNWNWTFEGESCTVVKAPDGRLFYENFDDYAKDFPEGEAFRAWITNLGHNEAWLVRLTDPASSGSPHGGLPGNFMAVGISKSREHLRLAGHDSDDGLMVRDFALAEEAQARQVLTDMAQVTPFSMWDAATVFGFSWT